MQTDDFYHTLFGPVPIARSTEWKWVEQLFHPLKPLYELEGVTDIMVDRFDSIAIEQHGQLTSVDAQFDSEKDLQSLLNQLAKTLNQPFDGENPILNARLPDFSRACCTHPAVTPGGATMTLRIAPKTLLSANDLIQAQVLDDATMAYLGQQITQGKSVIVSGSTGSGKTTLLRALSEFIPKNERVITCEDTQELYLSELPFFVSCEAPKREHNHVEMEDLIQASLRMRPNRIWVGEIRTGAAANAFIQAINTGHQGSVTTLHANSNDDAIARIQYLIASIGNLSFELTKALVCRNIDLLVHIKKTPHHGRRVSEITEVHHSQVRPVFRFNDTTGRMDALI